MPYATLDDLLETVLKNLPKNGHKIYKEAFNSTGSSTPTADERRGKESREEVSHKVA